MGPSLCWALVTWAIPNSTKFIVGNINKCLFVNKLFSFLSFVFCINLLENLVLHLIQNT